MHRLNLLTVLLVVAAQPLLAQGNAAAVTAGTGGQSVFFSPGSLFRGSPNFGRNQRFSFFNRSRFLNPFGFGRGRLPRELFRRGLAYGSLGYGPRISFADSSLWSGYFSEYGYAGYMYPLQRRTDAPPNPYPERYRVKGKLANDVDVLTGKAPTADDREYTPPVEGEPTQ